MPHDPEVCDDSVLYYSENSSKVQTIGSIPEATSDYSLPFTEVDTRTKWCPMRRRRWLRTNSVSSRIEYWLGDSKKCQKTHIGSTHYPMTHKAIQGWSIDRHQIDQNMCLRPGAFRALFSLNNTMTTFLRFPSSFRQLDSINLAPPLGNPRYMPSQGRSSGP